MPTPLDPTATAFLLAENRSMPMHVGGLQLFRKPEGAGRNYVRDFYEDVRARSDVAPLFRKHPHRSLSTGGTWVWRDDDLFDIDHHVRRDGDGRMNHLARKGAGFAAAVGHGDAVGKGAMARAGRRQRQARSGSARENRRPLTGTPPPS